MPLESKKLNKKLEKKLTLDYLLYLPKDYDGAKKFPLVIFLHGAGERGSNIELVKIHGFPKLVAAGGEYDFILAAPQCPGGKNWGEGKADEFIALVGELIEKYAVDTARIYLTGLSMGGFGTFFYGAKYKNAFAALAPICGGIREHIPSVEIYKDKPLWVFHGAKDSVVGLANSTWIVNELNNMDADVKFTVYPDADHDSWTETYDNPALVRWFLSKKNENFSLEPVF